MSLLEFLQRNASVLTFIVTAITVAVLAINPYIAYRNRQTERVKLTRDLYNHFVSILNERYQGWFLTKELDRENPARTYDELWLADNNSYNIGSEKIIPLFKVLSFWYLLFRLYQGQELDNSLVRSLFRYEFLRWQAQISPLVIRTQAKHVDSNLPEILLPFKVASWFP